MCTGGRSGSRRGLRRFAVSVSARGTALAQRLGYLDQRVLNVCEYPRSGGTWLARMLATTLEWPFHDDSLLPPGNNCVVRAHRLASSTSMPMVYVLRDPRDCMVSLFHHRWRQWSDSPQYRRAWGREVGAPPDPAKMREQMTEFIHFEAHFSGERGSGTPVFWGDHVGDWFDSGGASAGRVEVRYETLRGEPAVELGRIYSDLYGRDLSPELAEAVVRAHDIRLRRAMRWHTLGRSFQRQGSTGEWRNVFTRSSGRALDRMCGPLLLATGYADESWLDDLPSS